MDDRTQSMNDEIEESLRICEELLKDHPNFISEGPDFEALEELTAQTAVIPSKKPVGEKPGDILKPPVTSVRTETMPKPETESAKAADGVKETETAPKPETPVTPVLTFEPVKPKAQFVQPSEPETQEKEESGKKRVLRGIVSLVICVMLAVVISFGITKFVANHTTVDGGSMEPTLYDGDELVVEKVSYLIGKPERFDIIVFKYDEGINYIKRIIGLPGEEIRIEDEKIYIDDRAVFDRHGKGQTLPNEMGEKAVLLGPDEYFVLGDNRENSEDSRDQSVGTVREEDILGKAWLRVMPFETFGILQED